MGLHQRDLVMKTEIIDGRRVWAKKSIDVILGGDKYRDSQMHFYYVRKLLWDSLKEAGFKENEGATKKNHLTMDYASEGWFCSVHLLYLEDDAKVMFIVGLDMHPVEDLVNLWDYIRSSLLSQRL